MTLMQCGLSYAEARSLGFEETLCVLRHAVLAERLKQLDAESARLAGLSCADPAEQQRMLTAISHRAAAELDAFYRERGGES